MLHQWSVFQTAPLSKMDARSKTWRPWVSTWTNWPKYETKTVVKVAQHSKSWKSYAVCAYQYSLATREMAYMGALACALEGRAKRESNNGRSAASASHYSAPELLSSFICCWLKTKLPTYRNMCDTAHYWAGCNLSPHFLGVTLTTLGIDCMQNGPRGH